MDEQLELKKVERDLLDVEITQMLLKYAQRIVDSISTGKSVLDEADVVARKIVAHCREHIQ